MNPVDSLSINEFREQVSRLSETEWIKLGMSADYLTRGLSIDGDEVLGEALCRVLEGSRICPASLPIIVFLYGVMRSLVHDHLKKRNRDPLHNSANVDDDIPENSLLTKSLDTPEELLIAQQTLDAIEEAFSEDDVAQMIFMGKEDDYSPQEIQALLDLTITEYNSALRAIRRKINKLVK